MKKSYYEILGVSKKATEEEIKRAYASLIRRYPPEKFPEEFSDIAKAYESLMEIKNLEEDFKEESIEKEDLEGLKKEYYRLDESGKKLVDEILDRYKKEDYEGAIKFLKKYILLYKNNKEAKNYLSLCYSKLGRFKEAYNIEKEVFKGDSEYILEKYYINMANYCRKLNYYDVAEKYLLKGREKYDSFNINLALLDLYFDRDENKEERALSILINKVDKLFREEKGNFYISLKIANYSMALDYKELRNKYLNITLKYCNEHNFKGLMKEVNAYIYKAIEGLNFISALDYNTLLKILLKRYKKKNLLNYYEELDKSLYETLYFLREEEAYLEVVQYLVSSLKIEFLERNPYLDYEVNRQSLLTENENYKNILIEAMEASSYNLKGSILLLENKYRTIYTKFIKDIDILSVDHKEYEEDDYDYEDEEEFNKDYEDEEDYKEYEGFFKFGEAFKNASKKAVPIVVKEEAPTEEIKGAPKEEKREEVKKEPKREEPKKEEKKEEPKKEEQKKEEIKLQKVEPKVEKEKSTFGGCTKGCLKIVILVILGAIIAGRVGAIIGLLIGIFL